MQTFAYSAEAVHETDGLGKRLNPIGIIGRYKVMNRLFAAVFSLAALSQGFPALAAQQAGIDPAQVKGKITVYTHFTNFITMGYFDRWKKEFKAIYPNVEDIDVQGIADYAGTMPTRLTTGDYGDVLDVPRSVTRDELPDFFLPLDKLDLAKDFYFAANYTQKDHVYAFTDGVAVNGMAYNKAAFVKAGIAGVPKTWDELTADMGKLKAAGIIPIILNMGAGWPLETSDDLAIDIYGKPTLHADMMKDPAPFGSDKAYGKALGIYHSWIKGGFTETDLTANNWEDSKGWIASGKGAMWFLGSWSINQIIDDGSKKAGMPNYDGKNIGYFPLPYDNSGGPYNVDSGPDYPLAVSKNSKNPVAAEAWLAFILTKSDLSQIAGFIPGYKPMPPTLAQMGEFQGYKPNLIQTVADPSEYTNAANSINFGGGKAAQALMLADDYNAAVADLNKLWTGATKK
jgi:raffinose/stachyose/melibiose transport system substrate-binding protein